MTSRGKMRLVVHGGLLDGRSFVIEQFPCLLGKGAGCHVRLPGDGAVQDEHVSLEAAHGRLEARSLGSAVMLHNGRQASTAVVQVGDELGIGRRYRIELAALEAPVATADSGKVDPAPAAESSALDSKASSAPRQGIRLPPWLIGYLLVMVVVFGMLAVGSTGEEEDFDVAAALAAHAAWMERHPDACDAEVTPMLEQATAMDVSGRWSEAASLYREIMGRCEDRDSPAYRGSAWRVSVIE